MHHERWLVHATPVVITLALSQRLVSSTTRSWTLLVLSGSCISVQVEQRVLERRETGHRVVT